MSLHESLKGKKTTNGLVDFYEHISEVKEKAPAWLKGIKKNGIEHSQRLEGYLDKFIAHEFEKKLKPAEIFILLYAVYLHDIGYRNESGNIDHHDHARRSKDYILNNPGTYLFDRFPPMRAGEVPLIAEAVAEVCYGHAPESRCPLASIRNRFGDAFLCKDILNLRRLAAFLRLADEMDQVYIRLGHLRDRISLPEIETGIVRLHWKGNRNSGEALDILVQEINVTLEPVNDLLSEWDFPRTTVVLEPTVKKPAPQGHGDYQKYVPEHYIQPRCYGAVEKYEKRGHWRELLEAIKWFFVRIIIDLRATFHIPLRSDDGLLHVYARRLWNWQDVFLL